MASGDRFYMLELRHRPAVWGDIGNLLKIEGLVIGGEGAQAVLMLPGADFVLSQGVHNVNMLTMEEWTDWLKRSDDPEVLIMPAKAFHRKLRYEISGSTQQRVWVADRFKCMYCWQPMGKVQLTIDHFTPLEMNGANGTSNFLAAYKKCNKDKGGMDPHDWIELKKPSLKYAGGYDYDWYITYMTERQLP